MKKIFKTKKINYIDIICLFMGIVHFVITFFTDHNIFLTNELNIKNYIFCKVVLFFILILVYLFISFLIKDIINWKNNKNSKKKSNYPFIKYFKWFLIYIIPILIILLFAWPGTWYGSDVYGFYNLGIKAEYVFSLHYLTSVFYIIGYMLFPCTCGPIILQVILFGSVFSYIMYNLSKTKNKLYLLIEIPFFLPHTIFYVFYVNRPIIFGVLYLLLIMMLLIDYKSKNKITIYKFITLMILLGILANIRSEAIYLLIAVPIFIFIVYKIKINIKSIAVILGISVFSFYLIGIPERNYNNANNITTMSRNLPSLATTMSWMITSDDLKITDEEYENINKVLDFEAMKKYPSYIDCECGYKGGCIKGYKDEETLKLFLKSYISVVSNNFDLFLNTRYLTYHVAASRYGDMFFSKRLYKTNDDTILDKQDTKSIFGYKIRDKVYAILEGSSDSFESYNKLAHFIGSLNIPILLIIFILIYSILKRNLLYFLISGMMIGHFGIVFLTAPAAYFMYYFNVYMVGWGVGMLVLIDLIDDIKKIIKCKVKG